MTRPTDIVVICYPWANPQGGNLQLNCHSLGLELQKNRAESEGNMDWLCSKATSFQSKKFMLQTETRWKVNRKS